MADNEYSKYPMCPQQLTWDIKSCPHRSDDKEDIRPVKRCQKCGSASNAFALGLLAEFTQKTYCRATFFERIQCDNAYDNVTEFDDGYIKVEDTKSVYHSIYLPEFVSAAAHEGFSIIGKEEICTVDHLYNKTVTLEDSNGLDSNKYHYFYIADNKERYYIPIYANYRNIDNIDQGNIVAVLVVYSKREIIDPNTSNSKDDFPVEIRDSVQQIMIRITDQCHLNDTQFLYMKQNEYMETLTGELESYDYDSSSAPFSCVDELFKKVSVDCNLAECLVFMPTSVGDTYSDVRYSARWYRNGEFSKSGDNGTVSCSLQISKIDDSIKNGKISIENLINMDCLEGYEFSPENLYDFYFQRQIITPYNNERSKEYIAFAILLHWKGSFEAYDCENKDKKIHDSAFNAVIQTLCASLLAGATINKQIVLNMFQESTQHDLALKLQTVGFQHNAYKGLLSNYYYECSFGTGYAEEFYEKSRLYNSYVDSMLSQIHFFERGLSQPDLNQDPEETEFNPYNDMLYELQRQYSAEHYGKNTLTVLKPRQRTSGSITKITADKNMLETIIVNLLTNAFKYAYPYTNIYLDYYLKDNDAIFDVISFCGGISGKTETGENVREKIFERGYRHVADKKSKPGSGFGLYYARCFAKKHIQDGRKGDVILVDDVLVSKYHIPALEEAIQKRIIPNTNSEFSALVAEERRLRKTASEKFNYVAYLNDRLSLLSEVAIKPIKPKSSTDGETYDQSKYQENRFDNSFYTNFMGKRPTFRVTFRVIIPQPKKQR